jgi:DNA-binding GntR family transcriptional regulator
LVQVRYAGKNMITTSYGLTNGTRESGSEVERVYHLLRQWIIEGELRPGAFLAEPELAERCHTSRTPVREALSRLAQDGWVISFHRKGFQVQPITLADVSELYAYRRLFERYACERAAETATAAHIVELERIIDAEDNPNNSLPEVFALNEQFHLALAERTGNGRMIAQMRLTMAFLRRLNLIALTPDKVSHRDIVEAIKARDAARASSLMGEHMDFALQSMILAFR